MVGIVGSSLDIVFSDIISSKFVRAPMHSERNNRANQESKQVS